MKKASLVIFVLAALADLSSQVMDIPVFHLVGKPLLMISLGMFYLFSMQEKKSGISYWVLGAILFSFLGDVFLMAAGDLYFMLGLVSFLGAHIAYIIAYRMHRRDEGDGLTGIQKVRYAFPFILAGTGLITVLYPHLGELKLPVIIYASVLVIMVLTALFRYGFTSMPSFWLVFIGAFLFMVSDSLLAFNKFVTPIDYSGLWVMSTYIAAQYFIVVGVVRHG